MCLSGKDAVVLARLVAAVVAAITERRDSTILIDVARHVVVAVTVHAVILAHMAIVIEVRDAIITMIALAIALHLGDHLPWTTMAHLAAVMTSRIDGTTLLLLLLLTPMLTVVNTIDLREIFLHESRDTHLEMGIVASMIEVEDTGKFDPFSLACGYFFFFFLFIFRVPSRPFW